MSDDSDPLHDAAQLGADVRRLGAVFLLTELRNGLAILDTIDASGDRDADARRRTLARMAYDVVTERLARVDDQAVALTEPERGEITPLLEQLRSRLERDEKPGRE
jgi:hypothetical protein